MKKIALIGIGKMGLSHLAIANQTPGIKVEAICDTSKPLLRAIEKNTSFKCYSDYKKMILKEDLDAVMILVPNSYHFEIAKECILNGLHIFIEKPLTLSYAESEQLIVLADKHKVKGQVGYVNRFNPIFQKVKKLLDAGVLGEVTSYVNKMTGGVILKENSKGWRNDYSKGGGCLFDYGPHCLDLSNYFFGTDVTVASATLKSVFSTKVNDLVYTTLIHNNSILGFNYINWSDSSVRKATNTIEIMGTKGKLNAGKQELSIYLNEENKELSLVKGWNQIYVTDENMDVPYYLRGEDFTRQLISFSELINSNSDKSVSSLYDASITDKIIERIMNMNNELR
jgi:predicted dehydrogenase